MTSMWIGRWRIDETDLWSNDSIDLLEEAYIELSADGLGSMVVGALQADIDYRASEREHIATAEFSWLGDDDGTPASGRGWAQLVAHRVIRVKLFIHRGDEVLMIGRPAAASPRSALVVRASTRRRTQRRR